MKSEIIYGHNLKNYRFVPCLIIGTLLADAVKAASMRGCEHPRCGVGVQTLFWFHAVSVIKWSKTS